MVGPAGFEPACSWSRTRRLTRLGQGPTKVGGEGWPANRSPQALAVTGGSAKVGAGERTCTSTPERRRSLKPVRLLGSATPANGAADRIRTCKAPDLSRVRLPVAPRQRRMMELPLTSLLTIHPPAGRVSRRAARGLSSLLSPARMRGGRTDAKHCDRGRRAGRATRPSSLPRYRCERTRGARPPSPRASGCGRGCAELTDTLLGRRPMGLQRQTRSSKIDRWARQPKPARELRDRRVGEGWCPPEELHLDRLCVGQAFSC